MLTSVGAIHYESCVCVCMWLKFHCTWIQRGTNRKSNLIRLAETRRKSMNIYPIGKMCAISAKMGKTPNEWYASVDELSVVWKVPSKMHVYNNMNNLTLCQIKIGSHKFTTHSLAHFPCPFVIGRYSIHIRSMHSQHWQSTRIIDHNFDLQFYCIPHVYILQEYICECMQQ